MNNITDLLQFLDSSPVNFLAVETISKQLQETGFERLDACEKLGKMKPGKQFFLTNTDGSTYYVDIPDGAWEAGNEYTYPVSVRLNQLEIGDVTITPWNEVGSGSVIIYN